jgi:hypothetical protein
MQVKSRVEKLVASLADLDGRVTRIEERLDALEGKAKPAAKPRKPRATAAKPAEPAEEPAPEPEAHAEPEPEPEPDSEPAHDAES